MGQVPVSPEPNAHVGTGAGGPGVGPQGSALSLLCSQGPHFGLGLLITDGRFPPGPEAMCAASRRRAALAALSVRPQAACDLTCKAGNHPLFLQLKVSNLLPSFPHATSQTLLAKFKQQHEDNRYFLGTPVMEPAFIIQHFAGKVKYQIKVHVCPLSLVTQVMLCLGGEKGTVWVPWRPFLLVPAPSSPLSVVLGELPGSLDPPNPGLHGWELSVGMGPPPRQPVSYWPPGPR